MNLGVDVARTTTPPRLQPGIGLRPNEPDHPAAAFVPVLYAALWESVAAHQRLGLNVVVDVGVHDAARVEDARRRLAGLPVLWVGVRCPLAVIQARSGADRPPDGPARWQEAVHAPWTYDLEVDTSVLSPDQCAAEIEKQLGTFLA